MVEKRHQIAIGYYLLAFLVIVLLRDIFINAPRIDEISYDQFQAALEEGRIEEVRISGDMLRGRYADGTAEFETPRVDIELVERLEQYDVAFEGVVENTLFLNILSWVLPAVVFVGLWMFILRGFAERQGMGGMMSIGQSKAKVYVETDIAVTFADVAGVDEAKAELEEIVEFLKDRKRYGRLGARPPKGVLLVGPPGTGKTLLARAVAGEAGVPFFSINGSEFVEMFVGVGAARVRDLFLQARKQAPAIIFIDELDALGKVRGINPAGGHDEKEQTLNQLLAELDGFDPRAGLILLAATNRPEILDPALMRAGRFDRQVLVDRPDRIGRVQILKVHIKKIQLADNVDLEQIAELTPGFSGADIANLVNEAALLATRRNADAVALNDFTEAIERIVAGLEKRNRLLNEKERRIVAYHEMGHALIAMSLPGVDQVHKVSIIPRGIGSLGYTIQRPTEDRYLMTRDELEQKLTVLLGGRAAESLVFEQLSTGAADDLAKATNIARSMVTRYGMDERLGHATYDFEQSSLLGTPMYANRPDVSEESAKRIDESVNEIMGAAFDRAYEWLSTNRSLLEAAAQKLLQRESLGEAELAEFSSTLPVAASTCANEIR